MKATYKKITNYKYILVEDFEMNFLTELNMDIGPIEANIGNFIVLKPNGLIKISKGYAWDGPSGPTIDTKNFMRGSLVHDALYQLIRAGKIPSSERKMTDEVLCAICILDGMSKIRAKTAYYALRLFGGPAAKPKGNEQQNLIIEAP